MDPTLLALDTSTEAMALAVLSPAGTWLRNAPGGAAASAQLLPAVLALLAEAGIALQQLDGIAFGQGPGAFTGLRTACSVAQGLAFGIGKPVLAIDSLLLVADDAQAQLPTPDEASLLWVAMDARMDEIYAGAYRYQRGAWSEHHAAALYTLPALAACWAAEPPVRVAGSAIAAFGARLPLGGASTIAQEQNRAAALARLARQGWLAGRMIDPAQALPQYLRDKVALTTAERQAQRAAAAGSA
ncbi:tRNA (adenosine(37)-N6)-threonylcarbamoyltransferase complex dimerization subunit type 1 TsaB [Aquabacterium sp.]|uniref:tRNA (adenosine(37)-N6)-threonylcarbamoyltransferase complex dimerization subunit type 1 TsaB n=1 Tax=Aquabacterium sp. TaxID=1872578 RepID=UPI002C94128E|nr:tRNA (adenosine(37)-N6)-threonylcarbamoyltransferase complex dimerization subunit type 1 TsaB [Aquabacterium sp.]HSW04995.1 tRNA (adenosine(37)-N6)-threonylcarbamoyltransferase complex dimerization subunit type 1 TsaB [Aquabacterium sp.]